MNNLYSKKISAFLSERECDIEAEIRENDRTRELRIQQKDSWTKEISIMRNALASIDDIDGWIIFEFTLPRLKSRVDVVVLIGRIIFCVEFKVNAEDFISTYRAQAEGYAVDLKNCHEGSQGCTLVPVLISTDAASKYSDQSQISKDKENIYTLIESNGADLGKWMKLVLRKENYDKKEPSLNDSWETSRYMPTPGIIQQAVNVFSGHDVEEIVKTEAREKLNESCNCVNQIIEETRKKGGKAIIFVTGVPGAGKTLVGLNVVHRRQKMQDNAVFLSGNGPLVTVLRKALTDDIYTRKHTINPKFKKDEARKEVEPMIQMVHQYRDTVLDNIKFDANSNIEIDSTKRVKVVGSHGYGEIEHVAIFDEAQRAWTQSKLNDFYHSNYNTSNSLPYSEPGFLIWAMDLREDWAVIVCLVGGGQEIYEGETGIKEWIKQARQHFPKWKIYMSDQLEGRAYGEDDDSFRSIIDDKEGNNITVRNELHLETSQRSIRSEKVSKFVEAILDRKVSCARQLYDEIKKRYPVYITRSVEAAKEWCWKQICDKSGKIIDRCGVLLSSRAGRVKALGYDVKNVKELGASNIEAWFLNDANDTRSSYRMEEALSEFIVQGLEIDYATIIWDADYRYSKQRNEWERYSERGGQWVRNSNNLNQMYHDNAYRVLLTRSRKGMVIVVPDGDKHKPPIQDSTRLPEYYDPTFKFLHEDIGIELLPNIEMDKE